MPGEQNSQPTHVLNPEAVRWAIADLHASPIHSSFLLYLFLRSKLINGADPNDIPLDLGEIKPLLFVPGGPATKPLFRPFSHENVKSMSSDWKADHLPGVYAVKSLRAASQWMTDANHDHYALPSDHVERAKSAYLNGGRVSALALGAFLLRDFGFDLACNEGDPGDLIASLRELLTFDASHDEEFAALFHEDAPSLLAPTQWFQHIEGGANA